MTVAQNILPNCCVDAQDQPVVRIPKNTKGVEVKMLQPGRLRFVKMRSSASSPWFSFGKSHEADIVRDM